VLSSSTIYSVGGKWYKCRVIVIDFFKYASHSVFVGFAVMVVTIPLPVYLAGKAQTIQEERLKRTDSRVQMVTESELTSRQ